jgi:hypothetical protein
MAHMPGSVLEHQATRIPEAPAILAPERAPLTLSLLKNELRAIGWDKQTGLANLTRSTIIAMMQAADARTQPIAGTRR